MIQPGTPVGGYTNEIKAMQILCGALISGVVIFALLMILVLQRTDPMIGEKELPDKNIFLYIAGGFGILGLLFANNRYNSRVSAIRLQESSLMGKLSQYRGALILYMALCEAPALFSVIAFFLTGQYALLAITAVMLAAMVSKVPVKKKLADILQLDWNEQQEL